MNKWFVYQWSEVINDIKTPFYIGVGKIRKHSGKYRYRRAYEIHQYATNKRTIAQCHLDKLKVSKTEYHIDILVENIEYSEALAVEYSLVNLYGRKNIGTGCLYNLIDGGTPQPMNNPSSLAKHSDSVKNETHRKKQREQYYIALKKDPTIVERRRNSLLARHLDPDFKTWYISIKNNDEYIQRQKDSHYGKKVIINGIEYSSIREASKCTGIDTKTISRKMNRNLDPSINYRPTHAVEYCGVFYCSVREMSKLTGINRGKIKSMILDGQINRV